jgi:RNA polymerase sigma-70 factor (ECF subfamily)
LVLSEIDRNLLQRCLARKARSWEDFVDRFIGLVIHVINHTAQSRSVRLTPEDREDLAAEVFLAIVNDDFAILRRFRGESSLATYLTVVARRVVVRELLKRKAAAPIGEALDRLGADGDGSGPIERIDSREQIERLLRELSGAEADIVRLYHLEGKSYHEISSQVGIAENSIGPTLSRAREKMRRASANTASS